MTSLHEPQESFVEALEWQLRSRLRRSPRAGTARKGIGRPIGTLATILISMFVGAAGVVAAEHLQDSERSKLIEAQARIYVESSRLRLDMAQEAVDETQKRYETGVSPEAEVLRAMVELSRLEKQHGMHRLDLEEVRITGERPEHGLSAPRAGGRDFVTERLKWEQEYGKKEVDRLRKLRDQAQRRFEMGVGTQYEFQRTEAAYHQAAQRVEGITTRIELRQAFLEGKHGPEEVELLDLHRQALHRRSGLKLEAEAARKHFEQTQRMFETGLLPDHELHESRRRSRTLEDEQRLLELEIRILEEELKSLGAG